MKLSFITPTKYIKDYQGQGDFILALSHLMDRSKVNEYEKNIVATGLPIILDNGLFENHNPEGMDSLIIKAKRIKATHFVAPDVLYNKEETKKRLEIAKYITKRFNIKIMAVPQAETKEEYIEFYKELCKDEDVDMIGLSILAIPYVYKKGITEQLIKKDRYGQ